MPHALLLSPDDQAVSAITGVLEEMSVTYERPLDGVSAAQKLNSQSFDLVLVDCENLPAAKLIFDVCRRGKNGNNPVPIAIVDGRAGLPTAFRLGAELILTKPVSKDQARTTIRSAVGRVRKDVPANESTPAHSVDAALPSAVIAPNEERAHAAAASSQLTSFGDSSPSIASISGQRAAAATLAATPKMQSATNKVEDEIGSPLASPTPRSKQAPAFFSESHVLESASAATAASAKPKFPLSDDPVLRELETAELDESEAVESQKGEGQKEKSAPAKAATTQPPAESFAPVFSAHQQKQNKSRGPLVAVLVLVLAGGGLYGAWIYEPGFRTIAQPQVDRVLQLAGIAHPSAPASNPVKPATQPVAATTPASAPETTTDVSKTASDSATDPATPSAADSPTTAASPASPAASAPGQGAAVAPSTSATSSPATSPSAAVAIKTEVGKPAVGKASDAKLSANDTKKDVAAPSPDTPLPGESSAIILSSKGAEKRLAHSVPPKYPTEARSGDAQGTVVLKEVVDESGKVAGLRLVEGDATLAAAAIKAVKQWRYRPYERDGKALPFQTVVIIDFQRP
jgi:TonB family protein